MGLFIRRTNTGTHAPLYQISNQRTVLLVGLGNIGKEYNGTRHNIGFECIDSFTAQNEFPGWVEKKPLNCHLTSTTIGDARVIAIKPTTLMNLSGESVRAVQDYFKLPLDAIVVIHDELDIPFGQIRTRTGGGSAGHNGLKSLISHVGEPFHRVRIGIAAHHKITDSSDYVLGKFTKEEQSHLKPMIQEVNVILTEFVFSGSMRAETRQFIDS